MRAIFFFSSGNLSLLAIIAFESGIEKKLILKVNSQVMYHDKTDIYLRVGLGDRVAGL